MLGVVVSETSVVPNAPQFNQGELTWLNVSPAAIRDFYRDEKGLSFKARINGKPESLFFEWDSVAVIRAKEWLGMFQLPDVYPPTESAQEMPTQEISGKDSLGEKKPHLHLATSSEGVELGVDKGDTPTPPRGGGLRRVK